LAIELAAGRLAGLGLHGLANSLGNCFSTLTHGRRTALPRHQTLRATLDWSYRLLLPEDQAALKRLSVFNGVFTLEDADFVMGALTNIGGAADRLTSLVEKSLVAARPEEGRPQYRLLETTRAYGQDKLEESGEADPPRYRHAQRFLNVSRASVAVGQDQSSLRRAIADIRAALDWCLVRGGDPSLGIDLAAAAAPIFLSLSLLREHRKYLDLALDHLSARVDAMPRSEATLRSEMALRMTVVLADYYASPDEAVPEAQLQRAIDIARSLGDRANELKARWMLYGWAGNVGSYRQALLYARSYVAAAEGATDPTIESRCNRMLALGFTHLGQHSAAQTHIERALRCIRMATPRAARHAYDADDSVAARAIYARILWLRGRPDDAKAEAEQSIAEALRVGQDQSICWAIVFNICPVAIWRGDLDLAETLVSLLLERSERAFEHYHDWGLLYRQLLIGRTPASNEADAVSRANAGFKLRAQADLFTTFDAGFAGTDSLERAQADEDIWCAPELLRASAHRLLLSDGENAHGLVEATLLRSLEIAKRTDAKAWQLRAATSLASLYARSSRRREACALLEPILKEFRQGHDSRDFQTATRVLSGAL
jgi:predicted ATPase